MANTSCSSRTAQRRRASNSWRKASSPSLHPHCASCWLVLRVLVRCPGTPQLPSQPETHTIPTLSQVSLSATAGSTSATTKHKHKLPHGRDNHTHMARPNRADQSKQSGNTFRNGFPTWSAPRCLNYDCLCYRFCETPPRLIFPSLRLARLFHALLKLARAL